MPHIILAALLLGTCLSGCGQKGPLFLPDAHTREPVSRPAATPAPQTAAPTPGNDAGTPSTPASTTDAPAETKDAKKKPQ